MAKQIKTNQLPLQTDLTDAKVIGLDKDGKDVQMPLANLLRSEKGIATPAGTPTGTRFAGERWDISPENYGSTFTNWGGLNVPVKVGEMYVTNARFIYNAGAWKLERELVPAPSATDLATKAQLIDKGTFESVILAKAGVLVANRKKGDRVYINTTKGIKTYYWKNGTADADLVEMFPPETTLVPSLFDAVVDESGFIYTYTKPVLPNIEEDIPAFGVGIADKNGYLSIYTGGGFAKGEVETGTLSIAPNRLKDSFSDEITISNNTLHLAFPGMCIHNNGVMNFFYRKGQNHTGTDGAIMYKYSKDFGKTLSEEITLLEGGAPRGDGYFLDNRDSKAIVMSNGKVLFSTFQGYAKTIAGTPPYNIEYDLTAYKTIAVIADMLPDGSLDLASKITIELPNPSGEVSILGAGGLIEKNGIIYCTVYTPGVNGKCFVERSSNFGLNWEVVGKIADGYNENSITFIGETMYCLARSATGGGNGNNAVLFKSDDYGVSHIPIKTTNTYWHGHYLRSFGDTIMVVGRAYDGSATVIFLDKFGNILLEKIQFGNAADGSYAQSATFENYAYIIYTTQHDTRSFGVYVRKVERSKLLGLNY